MKELKCLYNTIMNDYSLRRYTIGWSEIIDMLDKRYVDIKRDVDIQFSENVLKNALTVVSENTKLYKKLVSFGKELDINLETLRTKHFM